MEAAATEVKTPPPAGTTDRWRRHLTLSLVVILVGSVIWAASVMNELAFPDVAETNLADTAAERALLIEQHLTQWRVAWFFAMIARVLIGAGLWMLGRTLRTRETGRRAHAATAIMWLGALSAPLGVARFAITLGSPEFAADPGAWFNVLWAAHWIGIVIATWALCWLTWRTLAPRWVVALMILTTMAGLAMVAPALIYAPGLLVFSAAALWRLRPAGPLNPTSITMAGSLDKRSTNSGTASQR